MRSLRVLLIGGPMYDPLYESIADFTRREGITVEIAAKLRHPELNARIEEEFRSGQAAYDLISTHTKYAPSQQQWLTPLDETEVDLTAFLPVTLELARIEGKLLGIPRNLDLKLLIYRNDLLAGPPRTWEQLRQQARELTQAPHRFGFAFPGKESGLFGHFFELTAMAGGQLFPEETLLPRTTISEAHWALELLINLYKESAPKELPRWHYDEVTDSFLREEVAMVTDWPGSFHRYQSSPLQTVLGLSAYPHGAAGRFHYSSAHIFAIPVTVRDRPAVLALLHHLTSREAQLL